MNRLKQLEDEFKNGNIGKEDYIRRMHDVHTLLWDYHDFIQDKNIGSVEILKKQVLFKTQDGIKMICDREDERSTPLEILNFSDYEPSELQMIRKFLKKDSVLLDIGANIGWYCLNLAKDVHQGRIIAFEPIPRLYGLLRENIATNNIQNVEPYSFGCSDKEEKVIFYYDPKLSAASSLRNLHEDRKKIEIKSAVKRIDDFIDDITDRIDFVKCDVEGAEIFVIRGALETIKKHKPVILLEMLRKWSAKFNYHPNDIIKILKDIGYESYYIDDAELVRIEHIDEETIATNFYFLHPEKHSNFLKDLTKS